MNSDWREYEPLALYTTLKVGGVARYLTTVTTVSAVAQMVTRAQALALPFVTIGGGSNLLISDNGYPGLVIVMAIAGMSEVVRGDQVLVTAGAGMVFDELVATTVRRGYWGLENLSHIPGTVGATPIQNVGAYGVEVADLIESVTVYDTETGVEGVLQTDQCAFGYRTSRFKTVTPQRLIITSVTFRLTKNDRPQVGYADLAQRFAGIVPESPTVVRDAVIAIRSAKFPDWHTVGTAGSFFKNPIVSREVAHELQRRYPELPCYPHGTSQIKCSLGYILDKICGLRGFVDGRVRLYEAQALVLVAERGATATNIADFAVFVAQQVYEKTGIVIEREVQTL